MQGTAKDNDITMAGWIKIHRQLQDHWLWKDPVELQWWLDILLESNYEDKEVPIKNKVLICKRGEVLYSYNTWAERWNTNFSRVRRFLKKLETCNMIVIKDETVTTRITVCKYESYQEIRIADESQMNRSRIANESHVNTTKEVKKRRKKEIENAEAFSESPDDDSAAKKIRRENIFWKRITTRYPSNRIGNRQNAIKKWMELSDEEMIQADQNMEKYLSACEGYVKTLQNYITEKCFTDEWIQSEIEINKKTNTTKEKLLTDPKNYKEKQIWDKYTQ